MTKSSPGFFAQRLDRATVAPARTSFLMWLVFYLDFVQGWPLSQYGIAPRSLSGLVGVVAAPLLHGSVGHIVANTLPLILFGTLVYGIYPRRAGIVFSLAYFVPSVATWFFASGGSIHIGASGMIYFLGAYLLVAGLLSRRWIAFIAALFISFLYGGAIYGLFPSLSSVSWEMHLSGFAGGLVTASIGYFRVQKGPHQRF